MLMNLHKKNWVDGLTLRLDLVDDNFDGHVGDHVDDHASGHGDVHVGDCVDESQEETLILKLNLSTIQGLRAALQPEQRDCGGDAEACQGL